MPTIQRREASDISFCSIMNNKRLLTIYVHTNYSQAGQYSDLKIDQHQQPVEKQSELYYNVLHYRGIQLRTL